MAQAEPQFVEEGFEGPGFPPVGFDIFTSSQANTWEQTALLANTGTQSAVLTFGPPGADMDEWLILPAIDTTTFASLFLNFFESQFDWADFGLEHGIYVSTTGRQNPADFVLVERHTPATHPIGAGWNPHEVDLSAFTGHPQVHVAFRYQGETRDTWFLDDINLFQPLQYDVGITDVIIPRLPVLAGSAVSVRVVFGNFGQQVADFDIEMDVLVGGFSQETFTHTVFGVAPDTSYAWDSDDFFVPENVLLEFNVIQANDQLADNNTWSSEINAYDAPRTPLGIFAVRENEPASAVALAEYYNWFNLAVPRLSIITAHVDDWFHAENPVQNEFVYNLFQPYGSTPDFVGDNAMGLDDIWNASQINDWSLVFPSWQESYATAAAPLTLQTAINWYVPNSSGQFEVTVDVVNELIPGLDYFLYGAITENSAGTTNDPGTFRILLPGVSGVVINPALGPNTYFLDIGLEPTWDLDNIRFVVWVMEGLPGGFSQLAKGTSSNFGRVVNSQTVTITGSVSNVSGESLPAASGITGVSPNPFNPSTTVAFSLTSEERVRIAVYNLQGRVVARLVDLVYEPGNHAVVWDGRHDSGQQLPSGVYFARMEFRGQVTTKAMTVVK